MGNIMSSNKLVDNRYVEYSRDSFRHRICDDLSEVILQYLSLEDKLRLQCVSKQFQRTIFQRHYELKFYADKEFIDCRLLIKNNGIDLKSFELLLKKCPNLRSIQFFGRNNIYKNYNQ